MATRTPTSSRLWPEPPAESVIWTGLLNGDQGIGHEWTRAGDRTFHMTGTFGTGGSVTMQGSNDNTNWFTLKDTAGSDMTYTAAGGGMACSRPRYVRPSVTAGDGTTALVCTLMIVG